jgi:hypothetical protein
VSPALRPPNAARDRSVALARIVAAARRAMAVVVGPRRAIDRVPTVLIDLNALSEPNAPNVQSAPR